MSFLAKMQTSFNNIYELCKDYAITSFQIRQSRKFGPYGLGALGGLNGFTGGTNMSRSIFSPMGTSFYDNGMQNYNYSMFGNNSSMAFIDYNGNNMLNTLGQIKYTPTDPQTTTKTPKQIATEALSSLSSSDVGLLITYLQDNSNTAGKAIYDKLKPEQQNALKEYITFPSTESE